MIEPGSLASPAGRRNSLPAEPSGKLINTQVYIHVILSELGFLHILSPRKCKPNSLLVVKVACWIAYEISAMTAEKTSSNSNKSVYRSALFQNAKIITKITKSKRNGNSRHSFTVLKI